MSDLSLSASVLSLLKKCDCGGEYRFSSFNTVCGDIHLICTKCGKLLNVPTFRDIEGMIGERVNLARIRAEVTRRYYDNLKQRLKELGYNFDVVVQR